MSERLYGLSDVAEMVNVGAAALANRKARTGSYGPDIPDPAYRYRSSRSSMSPLWTQEQIVEMDAARRLRIASALAREGGDAQA